MNLDDLQAAVEWLAERGVVTWLRYEDPGWTVTLWNDSLTEKATPIDLAPDLPGALTIARAEPVKRGWVADGAWEEGGT